MELRVKYAPRLREARVERMLTQDEAAAQIGVGRRTYQLWEAGQVTPRAKHQRAIVAWLNNGQIAA